MILFAISLIPWFLYLALRTKKALHMLQQNLYDENLRYFKWLIQNINKVFGGRDLIPLLFILVLLFDKIGLSILFMALYFVVFLYSYREIKNETYKKPLVWTARVKRLIITTLLLYGLPFLGIFYSYNQTFISVYYLHLIILAYLQYLVLLVATKINIPVEKIVYYYYKNKASHKLKMMPHLKVIGITGSYGKTSSKNILSDILNVKYNALPTPRNLNTPYGLMITINNHMDKFDEILIAEMGAYKRGEVRDLCRFVKPKYGILTVIGTAHLELFGSEENIQRSKFELIENLPSDGIGILNGDDSKQLNYPIKNNCKLIWIGIENKKVDIRAENIKMSHRGTKFDVFFKDVNKKYSFETKLLGYANIYNILAAIALGCEFGIKKEQLQYAVKGVRAVAHRLELKKMANDLYFIDDAYSSNQAGSKMALDVLKMMPGKKIIITPGMVDLGDKQYEFNKEFGQYMATVCDEVILVGKKQTKPIQDGLKTKEYNLSKIHLVNDVKLAFDMIHKLKEKTTYVLIENDLTDIFKE